MSARSFTPVLAFAALACAAEEERAILLFPSDQSTARSALIAVEGRFHAIDLAAPAPLVVAAARPATVDALLFQQSLTDLRISAGEVTDTAGGADLPTALKSYRATIDGGGTATWSEDQQALTVFAGFHIPAPPSVCRPLDTEVVSFPELNTFVVFAEPTPDGSLYVGTEPGELFLLDADLQLERIELEDGTILATMIGNYVADRSGRMGVITDHGPPLKVTWDDVLPQTHERISQLAVAPSGERAVITYGGTLWLKNSAGWRRAHRFLGLEHFRAGMVLGEPLHVFSWPARYLLEISFNNDTTRTTTISAKALSAIAELRLEGEDEVYVGDAVGGLWKRSAAGRWDLFADTQIGDPLRDLSVDGDRLVYVGIDGWGGSIVPGYGVCPHGPIMPSTDVGGSLAGRRVYFGQGYVVRLAGE